jgi:hypothetical protein
MSAGTFHIPEPTEGHPRTLGLETITVPCEHVPPHGVNLPDGRGRPVLHPTRHHYFEKSRHDPTGIVEVLCGHGLPEHPLGFELKRGGMSWIRGQYVIAERGRYGLCPVCVGQAEPEDMKVPADHGCQT